MVRFGYTHFNTAIGKAVHMGDGPHQDGAAFLDAVQAAINYGGSIGATSPVDAFNIATDHVAILLQDAMCVFGRRSFGTCVFLAITAIEETGKAELLGHRARSYANRPDPPRGRDPMRDHKKKHLIGIRPTTFMGRLPGILGTEACARLQIEAETGALVAERERSLYVHAGEESVTSPAIVIGAGRAREILLLALEAADDILVGYTNHSFDVGKRFEGWIAELNEA